MATPLSGFYWDNTSGNPDTFNVNRKVLCGRRTSQVLVQATMVLAPVITGKWLCTVKFYHQATIAISPNYRSHELNSSNGSMGSPTGPLTKFIAIFSIRLLNGIKSLTRCKDSMGLVIVPHKDFDSRLLSLQGPLNNPRGQILESWDSITVSSTALYMVGRMTEGSCSFAFALDYWLVIGPLLRWPAPNWWKITQEISVKHQLNSRY